MKSDSPSKQDLIEYSKLLIDHIAVNGDFPAAIKALKMLVPPNRRMPLRVLAEERLLRSEILTNKPAREMPSKNRSRKKSVPRRSLFKVVESATVHRMGYTDRQHVSIRQWYLFGVKVFSLTVDSNGKWLNPLI